MLSLFYALIYFSFQVSAVASDSFGRLHGSDNVCPLWREKAKARIARLHPALVIVSWARWMQPWASHKSGVPTGYGGPWEDGVAAIFQPGTAMDNIVQFIRTHVKPHGVPTAG